MPLNPYIKIGTTPEQNLVESLILESIKIYGQDVMYIPRTLVGKDDILGEDRFSKFKNAYEVEMYIESVEGFEGNGAFLAKWGLQNEESATLVVARKRWEEMVRKVENNLLTEGFSEMLLENGTPITLEGLSEVNTSTIIPDRPCEGDLIYFPLSNGLFEIKFVEHRNPFYQLGRLYTYKLKVELYRYNSDEFETGISEIDDLATENTFEDGTTLEDQTPFAKNETFREEGEEVLDFSETNPFGDIS